jgi:hypothetical protein
MSILIKTEKVFTFIDRLNRKLIVPALVCVDCNHHYPAYATEYNHDSIIDEEMGKCNDEAITECPYCIKTFNPMTGEME